MEQKEKLIIQECVLVKILKALMRLLKSVIKDIAYKKIIIVITCAEK